MCLDFTRTALSPAEIAGKAVLEVGSLDVNGSPRAILEPFGPSRYVGVDIEMGRGVDVVCRAEDLVAKFGRESFDVVISTEMLEHVLEWRQVVANLKGLLKPNGILVITTRRVGFPYHGYPYDFWRYERDDFQTIFSDLDIRDLHVDDPSHGIFLKAIRPAKFVENDLSSHMLFSILNGRRVRRISEWEIKLLNARRRFGDSIYPALGRYRNLLPPSMKKSFKRLFVRHYGD